MTERNQFVTSVADFSDHYSEDGGYSYSVLNLLGEPRQFPNYGESSTTFSTRHYRYTGCRANGLHSEATSSDFVDVAFAVPVYPARVIIYQTYTIGYISRIFCRNGKQSWRKVYDAAILPHIEDRGESCALSVDVSSEQKIGMLRIELSTNLAPHFIGIDAILLYGMDVPLPQPLPTPLYRHPILLQIVSKIPSLNILKELTEYESSLKERSRCTTGNLLLGLPKELCIKILKKLDLVDLCRCRMVCKEMYAIASDASLYVSVSARCCWHLVSPSFLTNLAPLFGSLKKLDLSWCGPYGRICPSHFVKFIRATGMRITHLYLSNCHFITSDALYWVASSCKLLEELNIQGCKAIESDGFFHLAMLDRLRKLWTGRTKIQWLALGAILESSSEMTHLGLGSCDLRASVDFVAGTIRRLALRIQVLDLWRVGKLSAVGVEALSGLSNLEELEIGWCTNSSSPSSVHVCRLVEKCRKLRRLGLAGLRVICDADLIAMADSCPDLQFVDLTGNNDVTATGCSRLLRGCHSLECVDVSYCTNVTQEDLNTWHEQYPNVSIKVPVPM